MPKPEDPGKPDKPPGKPDKHVTLMAELGTYGYSGVLALRDFMIPLVTIMCAVKFAEDLR